MTEKNDKQTCETKINNSTTTNVTRENNNFWETRGQKKLFPNLFCVGFAAESNNLINYAKQKLVEKNLDMIIANELQKTMGEDTAEVIILDKKQEKILPKMEKKLLANSILTEIYDRFKTNEN